MKNSDHNVVEGFGREWSKFDQGGERLAEAAPLFASYFAIFPWSKLPPDATGFDAGCGTGRWAAFVAPRVGRLHCVDASPDALTVARRNLEAMANCEFHCASVEAMPLPDGSADFGYSLGVLHHIPDTQAGIKACARKLRPGAPLLLYLYYAFDNRPWWFRAVWRVSDVFRRLVSRLPFGLRALACEGIAALVYWPLARLARQLERMGLPGAKLPLASYRERSFYAMRTDALDRFGTRLEQRFTREQIRRMMLAAGLDDITFSDDPWWCAVGYRR